jgi:hypothetical protein
LIFGNHSAIDTCTGLKYLLISGTFGDVSEPFTVAAKEVKSVAVVSDKAFFLEDGEKISVYTKASWNSRYWYYPLEVNDTEVHVTLRDLGLPADSRMQSIWAGERTGECSVLHVLYTSSLGHHALASYEVAHKWK